MDYKIFKNRKVLLICPSFYQYQNMIADELMRQGAQVHLFDERPTNNQFFKLSLRLKLYFFTNKIIYKYYENIDAGIDNNEITDVLVVNAEAIDVKIIDSLRGKFTLAKFTLYMWDSIKNKSNITKLVDLFDRKFSFDPTDCEVIHGLEFEPLFYDHSFESKAKKNVDVSNIDLSFVGSIHSDRLNIISKLQNIEGIKRFFYLYSPSKLFTILKFFTTAKLSISKFKNVSHHKLNVSKVSEVFVNSKCVVDIHHPGQVGLTMRTFEVLGSGRKLITTNVNIMHYDFYDDKLILVIDRNHVNCDEIYSFINNETELDFYFEKYRIDNWIKRVLI